MENMKQCPGCGESIRVEAVICRYCRTDLLRNAREQKGIFVRVRLKSGEKTYVGDLFVPEYMNRVSDVLNDGRSFLILVNAVEETGPRDLDVGFVAINKTTAEWVRLAEEGQEPEQVESVARSSVDMDYRRRR